jgi:cytochrome c biogenesis protein CcdA
LLGAGFSSVFVLLGLYSLELGITFLITGLAFGNATRSLGFLKGHMRGMTIASAAGGLPITSLG